MQKNEQNNQNASVNLSVIQSDSFYIKEFRAELDKAYKDYLTNPKSRTDGAEIMIVSHRSQNRTYQIKGLSYGTKENIFNTLAYALIRKLKEYFPKDRDEQEAALERFMEAFERLAYFELFEAENEAENTEEPDTDEIN